LGGASILRGNLRSVADICKMRATKNMIGDILKLCGVLMPDKNSIIPEQLSWYQRAARISGSFVILVLAAGLCGSLSGNFTTFLFFEGIVLMVLGYGIQRLYFGEGFTATARIDFNTEYPRKKVGGLRPKTEAEQTGLEPTELEQAKRAPEILTDIIVAGLLALIMSLILLKLS
jgi:hypothetical protein